MSRPPRRPTGPRAPRTDLPDERPAPRGRPAAPGGDRFSAPGGRGGAPRPTRPDAQDAAPQGRGPRPGSFGNRARAPEAEIEAPRGRAPGGRPGFARPGSRPPHVEAEPEAPRSNLRGRRITPRPQPEAEDQAEPATATDDFAERAPRRSRDAAPPDTVWLHGQHAVSAALANPLRKLRRLLVTAEARKTLLEKVPAPWPVQEEIVDRSRFGTFLPEDAVHQGVALLAATLPPTPLDVALARSKGPVLVLDQVTDPRNVGAILRSAAAFGAAAVVMQDRHAPPETGALARTASGALEVVPVVREVNLARAILTLQRAGYWVMGLAGEAEQELAAALPADRSRPVALVLGAEDTGLRRLQRETCDELVRLPITSAVESLNVSVAAAVGLYELARAR